MDDNSNFRFRVKSEGMAMDGAGTIIERRGPYVLIEGSGVDTGSYFTKKGDKARRFATKLAADQHIDRKLAKAAKKAKRAEREDARAH